MTSRTQWIRMVSGYPLLLLLLLPLSSCSRAQSDGLVIAEDESALLHCAATGSSVVAIGSGGDSALGWSSRGEEPATLSFRDIPADIRPYGALCLGVRTPAPPSQRIRLRIRSGGGALEDPLPVLGKDWKEMQIPLGRHPARWDLAPFDPTNVEWLEFVVEEPGAFTVELDDIRLEQRPGGWTWRPEIDAPAAANFQILDPETRATTGATDRGHASRESLPRGAALRWTVPSGDEGSQLTLYEIPRDITSYDRLRIRARLAGGVSAPVSVRIRSRTGARGTNLPGLTEEWSELDLPLASMPEMKFDPEDVLLLRFVCGGTTGSTIDLSRVELHRAGG